MRILIWQLVALTASVVSTSLPADLLGKEVSSPDGSCGKASGHTCWGSFYGNCCGADGKCSSTKSACGKGCQLKFGFCSDTKGKVSPFGKCGGELGFTCKGSDHGDCCSVYGYCGNGKEYCDHGCQKAFGACGSSKRDASGDSQQVAPAGRRLIDRAAAKSATSSAAVGKSVTTRKALCPTSGSATYTARCGASFAVECSWDRSGGDLRALYTDTHESCLQECSETSQCVGVSWVRGSPRGRCYLKKALSSGKADTKVYGGRRIGSCTSALTAVTTTSSRSVSNPIATSTTSRASQSSSQQASRPTSTTLSSGTTKSTASSIPSLTANTTTTTRSTSSASLSSSTSSNTGNATVPTSCSTVTAPTAGFLPNCRRCDGQPGNDQFCGYDINTNYYEKTPKTCRVVSYDFEITNTTIAPDGISRIALLVNGKMPGPPIRASWGDTVVVTVHNKLQDNGTSIHFHGMRQLNNNLNDGPTSITQCPIAPGESMTYTFVAENYGTSWYHSHYALQTWEGVFGPLIVDGPHSATFDEDLGSFMLQDWSHDTVDSMYDLAQNATLIPNRTDGATFGGPRTMDTGLINGVNVFGVDGTLNQTGSRLEVNFQPGKKYLLRLVNTAIQSSFKFSIDGHTLTVISADFVPITPYSTQTLAINIGQRYNIIVEANAAAGNYWMRADNQESCAHTVQNRDIRAIVRYTGATAGALPTSTSSNYTDSCVDEPYASLIPVVALNPGAADITEGALDVVVQANNAQLYKWYLSGTTFVSQYDDPTLLGIYRNNSVPNYSGNLLLMLPKRGQTIYVIIESPIPAPHPLHLHGHDFWVLAEGSGTYDSSVILNLNNPPRRDTVLLPAAGYVVLAFVTDNPGAWLMHCHIGWHTSMGFALQFVEIQDEIRASGALANSCALVDTCNSWKKWATAADFVMSDSGV